MDMSKLEQEIEKRGRESMRILLQEHLNNRSPGTSNQPVRDTDRIERIETPTHDRKIETVFGRVEFNRAGYGKQGCKSLHPLDAELNLPPEIYSFQGAEAVLRLRALRSSKDFDEYRTFHEDYEYKRNHQALYADGSVPATTNSKSSTKNTGHLKIIK